MPLTETLPKYNLKTHGRATHVVSAIGYDRAIRGARRCMKKQDPAVQIIGVQPRRARAFRAYEAARGRRAAIEGIFLGNFCG